MAGVVSRDVDWVPDWSEVYDGEYDHTYIPEQFYPSLGFSLGNFDRFDESEFTPVSYGSFLPYSVWVPG